MPFSAAACRFLWHLAENYVRYDVFRQKCFQYFKATADFQTAETICATSNGHLVSIHNTIDNNYLATNAAKYFFQDGAAWLGARASSTDVKNASNWHWTDGSKFDYQNYRSGQPTSLGTASCMQFLVSTGKWMTASCNNAFPFICSYSPITDPTTTCVPQKISPCPSKYVFLDFTNSCYKPVIQDGVNFEQANAACLADGANLASVHTAEENDFLIGLTKIGLTNIPDSNPKLHNDIYIGLVWKNNVWQWTDGSVTDYTNWADGEPNQMDFEWWTTLMPDPYSSTYDPNGNQWNNVDNGTQRGYICKRPANV